MCPIPQPTQCWSMPFTPSVCYLRRFLLVKSSQTNTCIQTFKAYIWVMAWKCYMLFHPGFWLSTYLYFTPDCSYFPTKIVIKWQEQLRTSVKWIGTIFKDYINITVTGIGIRYYSHYSLKIMLEYTYYIDGLPMAGKY